MTATATAPAPAAPAVTSPRTPVTPDTRESSSTPGGFDRQLDAARQRQRPAETGGAIAAKTPTETAVPAVQAAPVDVARSVDDPPADDSTADGGDQAASALAGAMLALLGPSVAAALRPAGAPVAVHADGGAKAVAIPAGAAALLQMNGAPAAILMATAGMSPTANALLSGGHDAKLSPVETAGEGSGHPATALALPAVASHAAPTAVPTLQLQAPVGSQNFSQELGQQVAWLSGQDVKQARIRLHPEELGQLDIKVNLTHDRVDVVFTAQHPGAANAVQQSLAQLGQMLAQHGLSLGHAEVGQHGQGGQQERDARGRGDAGGVDGVGEAHAGSGAVATGAVGLVDAFA